ncbi:thiamine phosphate synthase [Bacillus sp. V3B]|uniref:thiamine phosphate synthase n=1 Tax=Bacillus sp. V3B TaxID=2804915 RepID=UPI002108BB70|nr:thiamine phosphate synthase [Bacillus sp. V3B]
MAVTDNLHSVSDLASMIIRIKDIVDFVQIREKTKSVQEMILLLEQLKDAGVKKEKIIINDRLDLALLMNIPNLHLPEHGLPVRKVKEHFPHLRIGRSVHSLDKAKEAERDGVDYVVFGHCFETNSKKGKSPNGIDPIGEMKKELQIPVYAIGGISVDKIGALRQVKADGIAIMSGIFSAKEPVASTKQFNEAINSENEL